MAILVAKKNDSDDTWSFKGVFGNKEKAKIALPNMELLYVEIAYDRAYPDGVHVENMKELK